jgi:hypothetical protein
VILNVLSVVLLFVDAVCLTLALFLAGASLRQAVLGRRLGRPEGVEGFERGMTLVLLTAWTVVGLRALSWPLLYATLAGFVPTIDGAMCIFGVTRSLPALAHVVEAAKPFIVFLAGGWLLLVHLDRRAACLPLARRNTILLACLAVLVVAEAALEIILVTAIRPTFVVTCCTTVADVASRPTSLLPQAWLGEGYGPILAASFFAAAAALVALALAGALTGVVGRRTGGAGILLGVSALLGALLVPVGWLAAVEVIAPAWMRLPFHHCAYCFLASRDAPLAVAAFFLGIFCAWWAGGVYLASRHEDLRAHGAAAARRCLLWCAAFTAAAAGMAAIHLFAGAAG